MRGCFYPRSSGVQWDHVDWLWHHPEHINRRAPSREEAIALWKVRTGNRLLLETIDTPTDPPSLAHFDLPKHHRRPWDCYDPEHKWLRHEIASMFAGYMDPPDVHRMGEYLVAERLDEHPHPVLYIHLHVPGRAPALAAQRSADNARTGARVASFWSKKGMSRTDRRALRRSAHTTRIPRCDAA